MAVDLDERLRSIGAPRLAAVLDEVHALSDTSQIEPGDWDTLLDHLTRILARVTDGNLLALLRTRLGDITRDSHEDFIAVGKPSVGQLRRRNGGPEPDADAVMAIPSPSTADKATLDEFKVLLETTEAEGPYEIGDFLVEQNPYMLAVQFQLRKTVGGALGSLDTAIDTGLGGQFEGRNSYGPWKPGKDGLAKIPHPNDPGSKTWYMVTGFKPGALPALGSPEWNAIKSRARNIVKTVEIEYIPKIDSGELPMKFPHVFIMYAGGNGS